MMAWMCGRYPVCARLPEGAEHPSIHDRGWQFRHDQDALVAMATDQLPPLRASGCSQQTSAPYRGWPLYIRRLQDNKLSAHFLPGRLVRPGEPLDPGHLLARLRAYST